MADETHGTQRVAKDRTPQNLPHDLASGLAAPIKGPHARPSPDQPRPARSGHLPARPTRGGRSGLEATTNVAVRVTLTRQQRAYHARSLERMMVARRRIKGGRCPLLPDDQAASALHPSLRSSLFTPLFALLPSSHTSHTLHLQFAALYDLPRRIFAKRLCPHLRGSSPKLT